MPFTHFITASTFHRKRLFQNQRYGDFLTEILMQFRHENSVLIHGYVVMPDHIHLLITTSGDISAADATQTLQKRFADELAKQFGYRGEIWDASFQNEEVKTSDDFARCVTKIHSNPVRVGFCEKPGEYRMSSKSSHWVLDPLPEVLREIQAL